MSKIRCMRQAYHSDLRISQSFTNNLVSKLQTFTTDQLARITRDGGLDIHELAELVTKPRDYSVDDAEEVEESELLKLEEIDSKTEAVGKDLISKKQLAVCILAGGAGTRIGKPKALLEIPDTDDTLLSYKLRQVSAISDVWVIVSPEILEAVKKYIKDTGLEREGLRVVAQFESIRLDSVNNVLLDDSGNPSFYPTGHGDATPALTSQGIIKEFLSKGGKHIFVINVDNISASVDARICGLHELNGHFVTCEVVKRRDNDTGGFLCNHNGVNQIVESFRMTPETDLKKFKHLNTNTMLFRADLPFDTIDWSWHRVKKIVDGSAVIQYERLLQQLTECFKTKFVEVERQQRFQPIKSLEDLNAVILK